MLLASVNADLSGLGSHGHGHSDDSGLNPHKNICWDVSVFKEVDYKNKPCEKCHPTLVKKPINREHEVSIVK